jgi:hypothetical protein
MQEKIQAFRDHVTELSANPAFVHHKWFVEWHLVIVERITLELCEFYPQVDRDLMIVLAWLHDYGKILDFDHQYDRSLLDQGRDVLVELGFDKAFADKAADYIEWLDKKMEVDLHEAPIEVQIIASADGCSHFVGPFMYVLWHEATDTTLAGKTLAELMESVRNKATKDWERKIVLPEAREVFKTYHQITMIQSGELPKRFLKSRQ